jgi:GT2 family glycosyltransferase
LNDLRNRISIVILTYNRIDELIRTLEHTFALPEMPCVVVVDNASTDATSRIVAQRFPEVRLISLKHNIGAAARNIGVQQVQTPYVAFSDDDSWWAQGSLNKAVELLEAYPTIAALCARILLGPEEREDPICKQMEYSPLPSDGLPGPALLGFIACAVVFRRDAYLEVGGYEEKFFVGGEEELLTLDLLSNGWSLVYSPELTVHHYPSSQRDNIGRQKIVVRNALWVAWLRLPLSAAVRKSWQLCRAAPSRSVTKAALLNAARELPWVWRKRRVLPPEVQAMYRRLQS